MFLLTGLLLILPPLLMARRRAEAAEMSSAHAVEASLISLIHLHRPASGSIPWSRCPSRQSQGMESPPTRASPTATVS